MDQLIAKVGRREVQLRFEARTARVRRSEWQASWPLHGMSDELGGVLKALLRREPEGSDVALDVATIDRAIQARRRRAS